MSASSSSASSVVVPLARRATSCPAAIPSASFSSVPMRMRRADDDNNNEGGRAMAAIPAIVLAEEAAPPVIQAPLHPVAPGRGGVRHEAPRSPVYDAREPEEAAEAPSPPHRRGAAYWPAPELLQQQAREEEEMEEEEEDGADHSADEAAGIVRAGLGAPPAQRRLLQQEEFGSREEAEAALLPPPVPRVMAAGGAPPPHGGGAPRAQPAVCYARADGRLGDTTFGSYAFVSTPGVRVVAEEDASASSDEDEGEGAPIASSSISSSHFAARPYDQQARYRIAPASAEGRDGLLRAHTTWVRTLRATPAGEMAALPPRVVGEAVLALLALLPLADSDDNDQGGVRELARLATVCPVTLADERAAAEAGLARLEVILARQRRAPYRLSLPLTPAVEAEREDRKRKRQQKEDAALRRMAMGSEEEDEEEGEAPPRASAGAGAAVVRPLIAPFRPARLVISLDALRQARDGEAAFDTIVVPAVAHALQTHRYLASGPTSAAAGRRRAAIEAALRAMPCLRVDMEEAARPEAP